MGAIFALGPSAISKMGAHFGLDPFDCEQLDPSV